MKTKHCPTCSQTKPITDFYKQPRATDGYMHKCKECHKQAVRGREARLRQDPTWVEKERERGREKYHRLNYKEKCRLENRTEESKKSYRLAHQKWESRYHYKRKAVSAAQNMKTPDGHEKHHWSYLEDHWLDVIFLTKADHSLAHRHMVFDEERRQYRTRDGVLLDTKQAHIDYIKSHGVEPHE